LNKIKNGGGGEGDGDGDGGSLVADFHAAFIAIRRGD